jgi:hypothetical protein
LTFQSSLKLLGQLVPILVWMFIECSFTNFMFFYQSEILYRKKTQMVQKRVLFFFCLFYCAILHVLCFISLQNKLNIQRRTEIETEDRGGLFFLKRYIYRISVFFSRVPNFRIIRDSHRSAKKRTRVNFLPSVHKFFLNFLK